MIYLTCPQCSSELEIDDGFRGGVCRCFDCGTLMTVPDNPESELPESLSRPETPDHRPDAPSKTQVTTYTTTSGKKLDLNVRDLKKAPVARKRRVGIRASVYITGAMIGLALTGGVIYLGFVLFQTPPQKTFDHVYEEVFDIVENPYTYTEPNFMGLPISTKTVLMIDASASMRNLLDLTKQAANRSIYTLPATCWAQVVLVAEDSPWVYPAKLTPVDKIDTAALSAKLEDVYSRGASKPREAFRIALVDRPDQVTLVLTSMYDLADLDVIGDELRKAGTKLVVVHIDPPSDSNSPSVARIKAICKQSGGQYAPLISGRLQRWYQEYLDAGGS